MFEIDQHEWVPRDLDTMEPGPVMAALLSSIDIDQCRGHDRIRVLQAEQRMAAHYAARSCRTVNSVIEQMAQDKDNLGFAEEAATAEIAAALRLTRRAAESETAFAIDLWRRLPRVWNALRSGRIDMRRARVIVNGTLHLSIAAARDIVEQIIDDAPLLTTGQLGAKLRKLCLDVDPDDATDRYQHAIADRRVVMEADDTTGTAHLHGINLPPHRLAAGMKRINQLARSLRRAGETRTMDQLRADVLLDLLEGTGQATGSGKGTVDIVTDLRTIAGLSDHPGHLAGYGPVIADIARQVAEHQQQAEWRWTLVDPDTGQPIDGGITRRRPTAGQRRHIQTIHRTCIHPGCRMPAINSDLDHHTPWARRHITSTKNLAPLCRYHHILRHQGGWSHQPLPGGDYLFTSPLGHAYTTSGRPP